MRQKVVIAVAALAVAGSRAALATPSSQLSIEATVDGEAPASPCSCVLRGSDGKEHLGDGGVAAPPGRYELRVTCRQGTHELTSAMTVTLAAGQDSKQRVEQKSTRLRVRATRDGERVPALVRALAPGASLDAAPLAVGRTDEKLVLPAGRYDLVVALDTPRATERSLVRLPDVRLSAASVKDLPADLSNGSLAVSVAENGKSSAGSVRVLVENPAEAVATAEAGETLVLRPGPYVVETMLSSAADFVQRRAQVWIEPKKATRISERFTTGRLTVGVFREGQPVDALVQLSLPGAAEFFNYFNAPASMVLSPGSYDLTVALKSPLANTGSLRRPRVSVAAGKESKVSFDVSFARVDVKAVKGQRTVELEDVRVIAIGGGDEAARPEADGSFRLWPGRYEIVARLPEGGELRDGPFEVGFGERVVRKLEVTRGAIIARVTKGGAVADDAEVFVFRPGAPRPVAQGRSGSRLEVFPGTYDIKVIAGPWAQWREGVRVQKNEALTLDFGVAAQDAGVLPEGDWVLPEGEEP